MKEVERLKELLAKATPGEWEDGNASGIIVRDDTGEVCLVSFIGKHIRENDTVYIASRDNKALVLAMKNGLPAMIAAVEALQQIERLGELGGGKGSRETQQAYLSAYGLAARIARKALASLTPSSMGDEK